MSQPKTDRKREKEDAKRKSRNKMLLENFEIPDLKAEITAIGDPFFHGNTSLYIEEIINARNDAEARATDVKAMEISTYRYNEQALEFINELEDKMPTNVNIQSFTANTQSISIPGVAASYDDITDFIMQLKSIKCIDDVYISSIAQTLTVGAGATNASDAVETQYNFTLTCVYTNPWASLTDAEEE